MGMREEVAALWMPALRQFSLRTPSASRPGPLLWSGSGLCTRHKQWASTCRLCAGQSAKRGSQSGWGDVAQRFHGKARLSLN